MKVVWANFGKMEIWKMPKIFGLITEDNSDIDVINEILKKYFEDSDFKIKKFIGNGCGKIKSKCDSWTKTLIKSGCNHVLIFHDLDRNKESELRQSLEKKVKNYEESLVIIPKEELESWLLSDPKAIKSVFKLNKEFPTFLDCESIKSPKERIAKEVYKLGKKRYINTVHNIKIAKEMKKEALINCESFIPFHKFIEEIKNPTPVPSPIKCLT